MYQNSVEATKAVFKGKCIALHAFIRKDKICCILSVYLTKLKLNTKKQSKENKAGNTRQRNRKQTYNREVKSPRNVTNNLPKQPS